MRKYRLLVSLLIMVAVLLSACGGPDNTGASSTPRANGTPEGESNETPITGGEVDTTPTLAVTDVVEPTTTPVDSLIPTSTPLDGSDIQLTPSTEVPVMGIDAECNPFLLRNYLEMEVVDNTGNLLGEVDAIVIFRDAALTSVVPNTGSNAVPVATATPGGDATPTAAAGTGTGMNPADFAAPMVGYVVLDLDDLTNMGDQDVIVPFAALTSPEAKLPVVAGAGAGEVTPTADAAAGTVTPTPGVDDQGNIVDTACVLTFNGEAATLQSAPVMENDNWPDFTAEGWDVQFNEFWSNNGVITGLTGANGKMMGAPVVLRDGFEDVDVENANGDDLGEIEDFVVDPATGQFSYAMLSTGGFLGIGEKLIPIPVNQILWGAFDDDAEDMGEAVINVPEDAWQNAPSFNDLNVIDFAGNAWNTDVDAFWANLNPAQ